MAQAAEIRNIRAEADRIIASGVLGRSRFYEALLRYLVECGERDHAPKELEIAVQVFNKDQAFDPGQDSMVRVYAHNLRQKIEQYYSEQDVDPAERIRIPKGEYRIAVGADPEQPMAPPVTENAALSSRWRLALLVAASLVVGIFLGRAFDSGDSGVAAAYQQIAGSALWSSVTEDDAPVTVVVGDYFIFGELDDVGNVDRLVREFSINSVRDLDDRFMTDPEAISRYIDLDLTYLPSSIAVAMRDVVGVLQAADKDVRVVSMSSFDTAMIREGHVLYVGFLSGLGMLSDFVFAGSTLDVGETFDELINRETGESYVSEAGFPSGQQSYRDYGLFSAMPAPGGHRFVFIAGTRDEGLSQTAHAVTDPASVQLGVDAITTDGQVPDAFELLFEVAGLNRTSLDARIVHAGSLNQASLSAGRLHN